MAARSPPATEVARDPGEPHSVGGLRATPAYPKESSGIATRGSQRVVGNCRPRVPAICQAPRSARDPSESSGIGAREGLNESSGPRVARGPSESSGFAFAHEAPASRRVPRVARGPSESSGPTSRPRASRQDAPRVARDPSESAGIARARAEIRASRRELPRPRGPSESAGIAAPPRSWSPAAPQPCSRRSCAAFNLGHSISHQRSKDAATDDNPCRRCVGRQSGRNASPRCQHTVHSLA